MADLAAIKLTDSNKAVVDPAISPLQVVLAFLADRLDFGLLTDNAKRLKVVPEQATAANLNVTVASVASVTNSVRQGDLQMQRVNEALMDSAFFPGITKNLAFT